MDRLEVGVGDGGLYEDGDVRSVCKSNEVVNESGDTAIVRARSDASSSSTRQRGSDQPVVRLAAPQMTAATVLHELAHVLAGVGAGHGPTFRRAHVDLVGYVLGDTEAEWLLDAYAAVGLEPGARSWPTPPVRGGTGGPFVL